MGKRVLAFSILFSLLFSLIPVMRWYAATQTRSIEPYETSYSAREGSYGAYLSSLGNASYAQAEVLIPGEAYVSLEPGILPDAPEPWTSEETGVAWGGALSPEEGYVTWEFTVTQGGLYNIEICYVNLPGRGASIERTILINGELPYRELSFVRFPRLWENIWLFGEYDVNGNSIRPSYRELEGSRAVFVRDTAGYYTQPLAVYLEPGSHTITLRSEREPMFVQYIRLAAAPSLPSYTEFSRGQRGRGYGSAQSALTLDDRTMQAERHTARTDRANIPVANRDSSTTIPQDAFRVLINSISGERWRTQDSAIYWDYSPDSSGLYTIVLRGRQAVYHGIFSTRALTINGEVPFQEAGNIQFPYSSEWQVFTLGDEANGPWQFLFEAGKTYRIGLRVELGGIGGILRRVEESIFYLNEMYRTILMITGPTPDKNRDYGFGRLIPDVLEAMKTEAEVLRGISGDITALAGARTDRTTQIDQLAYLLERMYAHPADIADVSEKYFRDSISAAGAWLLESTYQPLDLDWIAFSTENDALPQAREGFFSDLWYGITAVRFNI